MAMVFINLKQLREPLIGIGLSIFFVIFLSSCGSTQIKNESQLAEASSLQFIPIIKKDSKGIEQIYTPKVNPYVKRQRAVRADSVELFIQARREYKANNIDTAEALLKQLTETNKRLSGPWVMLGDIALSRSYIADAENNFLKAIEINKNNVNAYLRLAQVKRMQGEFTQAKQVYINVLSIWSDFPEAHLNLGVLYDLYLNDDVKAQKHLEAYLFLTAGKSETVFDWLKEVQERTGLETTLKVQAIEERIKPIS